MSQVDSLIEQRIHLLAGCFALSVHAYAVMSNHLHLVIYTDPAAANRQPLERRRSHPALAHCFAYAQIRLKIARRDRFGDCPDLAIQNRV